MKKELLEINTYLCHVLFPSVVVTKNVFGKHWPSQSTKAKAFCNVHAQAQCKKDLRNVCNK